MRSYYDTLIDHLRTSNFQETNIRWQNYLKGIQKQSSQTKLEVANNNEIKQFIVKACKNQKLIDSYISLLSHLEDIIEQELVEILGPFYEDWRRFKTAVKNSELRFSFQDSFIEWLERYNSIPESLANYHRNWVNKNNFQNILLGIEQFYSRLGSDQTTHFYQTNLSKSSYIHKVDLDFDSFDKSLNLYSNETTYPNHSAFFDIPNNSDKKLNLKAKQARIRIQGNLDSVYIIQAERNGLVSTKLISSVLEKLENKKLLSIGNFKNGELHCLAYPYFKHCFFTKKLSLEMQIDGSFNDEEIELLKQRDNRFFPFYLENINNQKVKFINQEKTLKIIIDINRKEPTYLGSIASLVSEQ